jgi:hypothetical protein
MAVKLSVGLQKKVGLPDYGSLGASCHVEFEIDRSAIDNDLEGFHHKVTGAFAACRQAVNDQLAQQQGRFSAKANNGTPDGMSHHNGHTQHTQHSANGQSNGQSNGSNVGSATQSQVRAIFAIARRQRIEPATLVRERFNVERPEHLSIRDASRLIDDLKRGAVEVRS